MRRTLILTLLCLWLAPSSEAETLTPPVHPDEASILREIIRVEDHRVELAETPSWARGGIVNRLKEHGVETSGLKSWTVRGSEKPALFLSCLYNVDGRVLALSGNGPWLRDDSLRALAGMPELRLISIDHNGYLRNHPKSALYRGIGFDAQPYLDGKVICADFYHQLVTRLNELHADLAEPVRLIPAGEVMAVLDEKIRTGTLPGIAEFFARNQPYFIKARRNNPKPSPFDPEQFDPTAGVLNFYADGIHLNDQPHNGDDSGTIGSYVAALTVFATLSRRSPIGLTVAPYEQFDATKDAALIRSLQETVWDVVTANPQTGVAER